MVTSLASWVKHGRPESESRYRQEAMISIVAVITTLLNCAVSPSSVIASLAIGHESGSRSTLLNQRRKLCIEPASSDFVVKEV